MRVGRNFSCTPEQMGDFEALAASLGCPFSSLIRIAVEQHFREDLDRIRANKRRREQDAARKREQRNAKKGN